MDEHAGRAHAQEKGETRSQHITERKHAGEGIEGVRAGRTYSGELRLSPNVVRSIPSASVLRSCVAQNSGREGISSAIYPQQQQHHLARQLHFYAQSPPHIRRQRQANSRLRASGETAASREKQGEGKEKRGYTPAWSFVLRSGVRRARICLLGPRCPCLPSHLQKSGGRQKRRARVNLSPAHVEAHPRR